MDFLLGLWGPGRSRNGSLTLVQDINRTRLGRTRNWLQGGGQVGTEIALRDWSSTSLGPMEGWPSTLRTTLNLILNSGHPTLICWGAELLCFYNDACLPALRRKVNTLGSPLAAVLPESMEQLRPLFREALEGKPIFAKSLRVPLQPGGEAHDSCWAASLSPIYDDAGTISGVLVPLLTQADRIEAQARSNGSEEGLHQVSDIVPSLLWRASPQGEILWANNKLREGLSSDNVWQSVHPDDLPSVRDTWARSQRDEATFRHYHRLRMRNGEYRWHIATSEPRSDGTGEIVEWYGVATDVDDLHQSSTALSKASAVFRSFAENSADAIWVIDVSKKTVEYTSPACRTIWGELPEPGFSWYQWRCAIHPDDRAHQDAGLERLLSGEVLREQYRIVRTDGAIKWIRSTKFPIFDSDGSIRLVGGIAQDITDGGYRTIHLIDGEMESRVTLNRRFQANGYDVRSYDGVDTFLKVCRGLVPGCVILLDSSGGVEATRLASALRGEFYAFPLLVISEVADASTAIQLMKQGIKDIVLPTDPLERLDQAISSALSAIRKDQREGDTVRRAKESMQILSDREREVLLGLSDGATNKELARELGVSPRTIETHRVHIMEKLGVSTLPEAAKIVALAQL
ncbi:PAS domain S-box protein [Aurantiacibacter xanthus]|uniref:histidine kinase n=1 Tax=Aurantiacibacter xanthus TaxID=1784712 RepID=A0A3A1P372_9SPHN|nr:PAS domain-containing protein [Aurantiacibacter xanthus]RIV84143.1 PAS domain S-box protein [Aurantiacibacter xanthus]